MLRSLAIAAFVLLPGVAGAVDATLPPGWTEAKRTSDVIIFYKDNPTAHARDVLAYTEIDAPPEKVFRLVTDFESWPKFMPYSKESRILERPAPNELLLYQLVSPPFVSDRDYYLRVKLTYGTPQNGGVYKSQWACEPDYLPERKGIVRMRVNQGSWTYEPIDGGKRTRLTYSLLSHPAGSIPDWLVNRSNLSLIPNLFKAVRQRVLGQ